MEILKIVKRDNLVSTFSLVKITNAIEKAMISVGKGSRQDAKAISLIVHGELLGRKLKDSEYIPNVEEVQDIIEYKLMDSKFHNVAKAYILYREEQTKNRKPDIFKKRQNIKPYEYPELGEFADAIRHAYWIHTEFNYTSDIQDFKISINDIEREIVKKALMFVAQVELSVEEFWLFLQIRFPKAEFARIGATFAESEVRHLDGYSHLLEILGLNDEFNKLSENPALLDRVNFLDSVIKDNQTASNQEYAENIFLFSLFVENASLFTLFFIIMSFNKHKNIFKGISNVVEATSKEEQIHAMFASETLNTIKKENPSWFDEKHSQRVKEVTMEYFEKELKVIDYIFEQGDVDFLRKEIVIEFIKDRFNRSLDSIGIKGIFEIKDSLLEETEWFDEEIIGTKHGDFFVKRSINYSKRSKSITSDDLF